ncbi:MAG: hypothetical protein MJH10_09990 [Epibacterium sp.]|nr:hypothetical protein [Epibacterium sp.]NQX73867.1 hypothetical protein [Epibacterium sp.]
MKAKVTNPLGYRCAPQGHTVVTFPIGTVLEGDMARAAIASKDARRINEPRKGTKVQSALETKG